MYLNKRLLTLSGGKVNLPSGELGTQAECSMQHTKNPFGPSPVMQKRVRAHHIGTVLMLFTLAVQYILGMVNNLFGTFPATSDVLAALESGDPALIAHMVVAFVLLALGVLVAVLGFRRPLPRRVAALGVAGVLSIFWAFESGIEFVLSGFGSDLWSFSMSLGFLAALTLYAFLGLITAVNGGSLFAPRLVLDPLQNAAETGSGQARS